MLELLSLIPGIGSLIENVTKGIFDAKVRLVQIRTGADRDVAIKMVSAANIQATRIRHACRSSPIVNS